jgi:EAL domain-containing protein (putative c-di-GMP-specific phosphodiesterase class I)
VNPIGDWVLTTAVAQAATSRRSLGDDAPVIWVNISVEQLGRHHLTNVVERLLSTSGLTRGQLGLEVTERQLIRSTPAVAADLTTLRDMGVSLAVDDFGTGYASRDYLRRFTFDEIKIDRSFVAGLGHDKTDTAITSSIVALGRALDLSVVAEGVETQDQHDHLRELGCAVAQGYLLHRPAPAEMINTLLYSEAAGPSIGS